MNKFFNNISLKWILIAVFLIGLAVFVATQLLGNTNANQQVYTVVPRTVLQSVQLSGVVAAVSQQELAFESAGKIKTVKAVVGQEMEAGAVIAELEHDTLDADLLQAQGAVQSAQAQIMQAEADLASVRAQNRGVDVSIKAATKKLANTVTEQETQVRNSYKKLLNSGLQAYPTNHSRAVDAPIITGNYNEDREGSLEIEVYSSGARTGYSARISGLVNDTVSFREFGIAEPIGNTGLFISLPSTGSDMSYGNSDWSVPVPNTRSATYQSSLSAYESARETQIQTVAEAQSDLDTLLAQQANGDLIAITTAGEQQAEAYLAQARGGLTQALGALARVQTEIANTKITAPFAGTIARIDYAVGDTIAEGDAAGITLISDGEFILSMSIPEIDIAKVAVGDRTQVTLDVYRDTAVWDGEIKEIELIEAEVDGVPVYTSKVVILNPDNRIRVGMNARTIVEIAKEENVLAIPASYVTISGETALVQLQRTDGTIEERMVTLGIRGTDNFYKVTEGLSANDVVIKSTSN